MAKKRGLTYARDRAACQEILAPSGSTEGELAVLSLLVIGVDYEPGHPVGADAPDGTYSVVSDDELDIWSWVEYNE